MLIVSGGWPTATAFWREAVRTARRANRSAPYLAFALRTDSVIDPHERERFDAAMEHVINGSVGASLEFVRADHIVGNSSADYPGYASGDPR